MEGSGTLEKIRSLLVQHDAWRVRTLNMTPSENILSPTVRAALRSDLLGRYADYNNRDLSDRRYRGTRFMSGIDLEVSSLARRLFNADYAELRPISGHLAGTAVLAALCRPGDTVLELDSESGGHREATKLSIPPLLSLEVRYLPFDASRYNLDLDACEVMIKETRPRVVILGSSNFLFPHPVREIKGIMERTAPDGLVVYDGSHVMGFLAASRFQKPLEEGADVIFGSTHKTLPGPQGGLILSNHESLIDKISQAVYPALVTNHHPFRMPALGLALAEMQAFGAQYVDQITANSRALGTALDSLGVGCVSVDGEYSRTHVVLCRTAEFGSANQIARRLEDADIIASVTQLPNIHGGAGIRFGTQEITRFGAGEEHMVEVARLIAETVEGNRPGSEIAKDVRALRSTLGSFHYTWQPSKDKS